MRRSRPGKTSRGASGAGDGRTRLAGLAVGRGSSAVAQAARQTSARRRDAVQFSLGRKDVMMPELTSCVRGALQDGSPFCRVECVLGASRARRV